MQFVCEKANQQACYWKSFLDLFSYHHDMYKFTHNLAFLMIYADSRSMVIGLAYNNNCCDNAKLTSGMAAANT